MDYKYRVPIIYYYIHVEEHVKTSCLCIKNSKYNHPRRIRAYGLNKYLFYTICR